MLNKVILRNFLSWSELEFDINSGISLIDGWNYDDNTAEGSGKSAIFNAVSWCLFGKLPKDTKIDDIIKDGETSCQVVLIFDNDKYRVIRSRKPNDLYIVNVETQQKIKGKDAKETQTLIEEFVGLSFESFCQSIYFAQNYDKKFITSNNEEKGKILSEIQDLNIFDKARKNTLELIKLEESTHATLTKNLELKRNEVEYTKQLIISEERNYQLQLDNIANRRIYLESKKNEATLKTDALLESMRIKEKELSNKLSLIDNMNVDILRSDKDNLLAELSKLELARSSIETNKRSLDKKKREIENILNSIKLISTKKARLEEYAKNDNKKCPTCGSDVNNFDPITHQQEVDLLDKELANYVENLSIVDVEMEAYRNTLASSDESSFNLKRTEIQEQMSILTKSISAHETNISNAEFLRFQIKQIVDSCNTSVNEVAKLHLELERLNEQSLVIDESIVNKLKDKMTSAEIEVTELKKLATDKYDYIQKLHLLKDGFKEIKSYVFNNVIGELQLKSNEYAAKLFEIPVYIKFTNEDMKIGVTVKLDSQERSLSLLSGGQFRRVSLAVDLALSDIVLSRKNSRLNLIAMDEPFQNLSESSMQKCVEVFSQLDKPLLLIEHNSVAKSVVNNTVFVEYRNGTSHV